MKPAMFAICLISLGACSGESRNVRPVTIQWMDWPAEVGSGQVFRTRLIVSAVCAREPQFHPGARADQSAVTFAPYWVVGNEQIACIADVDAMAPLLVSGFDTAGTAPGLSSTYARTFEMRGSASVYVSGSVSADEPVRTFGEVIVLPRGSESSQRNAAGIASKEVDTTGCVRLRPFGAWRPGSALPLENQADTARISYTFVRGYIYDAATPVCGETRVFHLVSQN